MNVRPARPEDHAAIRALVTDAFAPVPQSNGAEADIVEAVRQERAGLADLVAEEDGRIIGHILFSRMTCEPAVFVAALGPVAVAADHQGKGVGAALISRGLRECRALGVRAVVLLGHPTYYPRFGFSAEAAARIASPYAGSPAFMALALTPGALDQPLKADYPAAFG